MKFRMLVCMISAALLIPAHAAEPPPAANDNAEVAPKFAVLPFLLSAVGKQLFSMFSDWLTPRLTGIASSRDEIAITDGPPLNLVPASEETGSIPRPIAEEPSAPLKATSSNANYQGVHVAIAVLSPDGKKMGARPLSQGFRSGERFKVRVVATFTGDLKLENINPKWELKQVFPADEKLRVRLEAGKEVLIPAGKDDYFEFSGNTGEEQLVVTVRHPLATEKTMSHAHVYRKDEDYGSNFIQEISPTTYPVISESVKLQHF